MSEHHNQSVLNAACNRVIRDLSTVPECLLKYAMEVKAAQTGDKPSIGTGFGGCCIAKNMQQVEIDRMPDPHKAVWNPKGVTRYSMYDDDATIDRQVLLFCETDDFELPWSKRFDEDKVEAIDDETRTIIYLTLILYLINDAHVFSNIPKNVSPYVHRIEQTTALAYQFARKCELTLDVRSHLKNHTVECDIRELYLTMYDSMFSIKLNSWVKEYIEHSKSLSFKLVASVITEYILNQPLMVLINWIQIKNPHLPGLYGTFDKLGKSSETSASLFTHLYHQHVSAEIKLPENTVIKMLREMLEIVKLYIRQYIPIDDSESMVGGMNCVTLTSFLHFQANRTMVKLKFNELFADECPEHFKMYSTVQYQMFVDTKFRHVNK